MASEAFYEVFGLFGSPKLQYLEKNEFLFPANCGCKGSKKRVIAIISVIKYLEDPLDLLRVESENVELLFS